MLLSQLSVALVTKRIVAIPPKNAPNFRHFSHPEKGKLCACYVFIVITACSSACFEV
jgi:hypothetical protein